MKVISKKSVLGRATQSTFNNSILLVGRLGTGKTRVIAEALNRNQHVLMIHCGLGEPGTPTLLSYLEKTLGSEEKARTRLDTHFRQYWAQSSEEIIEICNHRWEAIAEILADDPDFLTKVNLLVFEELNMGQTLYELDIVPKEKGVPQPSQATSKGGSGDSFAHYHDLQAFTQWTIQGLMRTSSPHQKDFRILITTHESKKVDRAKGADTGLTGPALQTTAAVALVSACSYAIGCEREDGLTKKAPPTFWYVTSANSSLMRIRGEGWPKRFVADPVILWDLIERKLKPKDIPSDIINPPKGLTKS